MWHEKPPQADSGRTGANGRHARMQGMPGVLPGWFCAGTCIWEASSWRSFSSHLPVFPPHPASSNI